MLIEPGDVTFGGKDTVAGFFQGGVSIPDIVLKTGVGGFEDQEVFDAGGKGGSLPVARDEGNMFFGATVDKGVGMRGTVEGHAGPAVFGELCSYFSNLGIVGEKVVCQEEAECFNGGREMIFGQCVHCIFHGIGGQDFGVIADGVYGFEVTGE